MYGEKQKRKIERRTNRTKWVLDPMIKLVIVILCTKYEFSLLFGCEDIFDENVERKKKEQYRKE